MFRMIGKKVELYRFKINYTQDRKAVIENCISLDHKNEIEQGLTIKKITFKTAPVIQTNNEWFNGLEFDSYDEALIVFNVGKVAHDLKMNIQTATSNEQLRADIDYTAILMGVVL